jgi:hypothetical protein
LISGNRISVFSLFRSASPFFKANFCSFKITVKFGLEIMAVDVAEVEKYLIYLLEIN